MHIPPDHRPPYRNRVPVFSTMGRGPRGDKGDKGDKGEPCTYDGDAVYTKEQVDEGFYTKDAVDDGFYTKDDVYNKGEIEEGYYTKSEVDEKTFTLSYVGNYGAVEKSSNVNWQQIVNAIAQVSDTIDFGNGQWYFSSGIAIPNNIRRISGSGTIITVTEPVEKLFFLHNFRFQHPKRFFSITGLTFDGLSQCESFVYADETCQGNTVEVYGCSFREFTGTAVYSENIGSVVADCLFYNDHDSQNTGVGIRAASDAFIDNCKFFYIGTPIVIDGNSQIRGCYFWTRYHHSPAVAIRGLHGRTNKVRVSSCEFDCMTYCLLNIYSGIVEGNNFYWNPTDIESEYMNVPHAIFAFDNDVNEGSYQEFGPMIFDKNTLSMKSDPDPTKVIAASIGTVLDVNGRKVRAKYYSSKGNLVLHDAYTRPHFNILCGVSKTMVDAVASGIVTHFMSLAPNDNFCMQRQLFNLQPDDVTWKRRDTSMSLSCEDAVFDELRKAYVKKNDKNKDFWLTCRPDQIKEVVIEGGIMYDMKWEYENESDLDNGVDYDTVITLNSKVSRIIPDNANLDDCTESGIWRTDSGAATATLTNKPPNFPDYSIILEVKNIRVDDNNIRIEQMFRCSSLKEVPQIWKRTYTDYDGWSDWVQIVDGGTPWNSFRGTDVVTAESGFVVSSAYGYISGNRAVIDITLKTDANTQITAGANQLVCTLNSRFLPKTILYVPHNQSNTIPVGLVSVETNGNVRVIPGSNIAASTNIKGIRIHYFLA